ncbi:MAG: hypothetical protein CGW95_14735, partial [Phenylobacterium zucineum]
MQILYLDDSGSVGNAADKHIVLGGLSVDERTPHWLSIKLDEIAQSIWPDNPSGLEFRGADMFSGRKQWRGVGKEDREKAFCAALQIIGNSTKVRLFVASIHKTSVSPADPMELAFEHVANRFDRMLRRMHLAGDTQRGLMVLDKSSYETSIQKLAREFRIKGHRWGQLHNIADVPLFVDSTATRLIQYADLIAYACRRYFENGDSKYFELIERRFDASGGVVHGLEHSPIR